MRLYVGGPMRGYEKYNYPAFDKARDKLLAEGHDVISPADIDRAEQKKGVSLTFEQAIRRDFEAILTCDAIYLLKGWERSTGANYEVAVATALGLKILREDGALSPIGVKATDHRIKAMGMRMG